MQTVTFIVFESVARDRDEWVERSISLESVLPDVARCLFLLNAINFLTDRDNLNDQPHLRTSRSSSEIQNTSNIDTLSSVAFELTEVKVFKIAKSGNIGQSIQRYILSFPPKVSCMGSTEPSRRWTPSSPSLPNVRISSARARTIGPTLHLRLKRTVQICLVTIQVCKLLTISASQLAEESYPFSPGVAIVMCRGTTRSERMKRTAS